MRRFTVATVEAHISKSILPTCDTFPCERSHVCGYMYLWLQPGDLSLLPSRPIFPNQFCQLMIPFRMCVNIHVPVVARVYVPLVVARSRIVTHIKNYINLHVGLCNDSSQASPLLLSVNSFSCVWVWEASKKIWNLAYLFCSNRDSSTSPHGTRVLVHSSCLLQHCLVYKPVYLDLHTCIHLPVCVHCISETFIDNVACSLFTFV